MPNGINYEKCVGHIEYVLTEVENEDIRASLWEIFDWLTEKSKTEGK